MNKPLGTLEELPQSFRDAMDSARVGALWPTLRELVPHNRPHVTTQPGHWSYAQILPLLLQAGQLVPVEKAERRVLVLNDPGRGRGAMQVTSSIYVGLQLLLPGEQAPLHRHTPSAARIVIEGAGAYTTVNGQRCPMHPGDLILTPSGQWHEHGHDGSEPVVWLDALDIPLLLSLEGSYGQEGTSQPAASPSAADRYPRLRYPWTDVRAALASMDRCAEGDGLTELAYLNPQTGEPCLPTLGFTAMWIRPGGRALPPLRSASAVFHVIEGSGRSTINGAQIDWTVHDTFSAPVFAAIEHAALGGQPACLIRIDDRPLQTRLGYYEESARG